MKNVIIFFLILPFCVFSQNADTLIIKFLTVPVSDGKKLTLQAPVDSVSDIVVKSNPGHFYLKKGTFRNADFIDVEVNNSNLISALSFYYDSTFIYGEKVEIFSKMLGPGREYSSGIKGGSMKVTKWEDRLTIFEVAEIKSARKPLCYSAMFDKELYFKQHKPVKGSDLENNSVEILKVLKVL
jgi:hypothetical protein